MTGETFAFIAGSIVLLAAVWVFSGRWLSLGPGRWFTSGAPASRVRPVAVDDRRLILDTRKWDFDHRESHAWRIKIVGADQLILAMPRQTFLLGTVTRQTAGEGGLRVEFAIDHRDHVTLARARGLLAWPTPFDRGLVAGASRTWRRHLYHRLRWTKPSGQTLLVEWRGEQWFYPNSGWVDANDERLVHVRIRGR